MAPFQSVPGPPLAPTTFFPSIESLPLPTLCYPLSLAREGGGPISLIVGPLKGDEKEDDGERGRQRGSERERETRRETSISSRAEIANGVDVAPSSSSSFPALCPLIALFIYLLHPLPPSRIRRRKSNAPTAKVRGALTSPSSFCRPLSSSSFVPFGAILIPLTKSP